MEVHFVLMPRSGKPKKFKLGDGEFITIGRGENCHITIDDDSCSTKHCKVSLNSNNVLVEDLDSKNGTFVNELKIIEQRIYIDDKVRIGNTNFFIFPKRMKTEIVDIFKYKGKDKRSLGNLTLELNKEELSKTKTISLKKKQKTKILSEHNKRPQLNSSNHNEPRVLNNSSKSSTTELSIFQIALIKFIDALVGLLFFFFMMVGVTKTYSHIKEISFKHRWIEFIIHTDVLLFSIISLFCAIVFVKVLKVLMRGSIGELVLGIKR